MVQNNSIFLNLTFQTLVGQVYLQFDDFLDCKPYNLPKEKKCIGKSLLNYFYSSSLHKTNNKFNYTIVGKYYFLTII